MHTLQNHPQTPHLLRLLGATVFLSLADLLYSDLTFTELMFRDAGAYGDTLGYFNRQSLWEVAGFLLGGWLYQRLGFRRAVRVGGFLMLVGAWTVLRPSTSFLAVASLVFNFGYAMLSVQLLIAFAHKVALLWAQRPVWWLAYFLAATVAYLPFLGLSWLGTLAGWIPGVMALVLIVVALVGLIRLPALEAKTPASWEEPESIGWPTLFGGLLLFFLLFYFADAQRFSNFIVSEDNLTNPLFQTFEWLLTGGVAVALGFWWLRKPMPWLLGLSVASFLLSVVFLLSLAGQANQGTLFPYVLAQLTVYGGYFTFLALLYSYFTTHAARAHFPLMIGGALAIEVIASLLLGQDFLVEWMIVGPDAVLFLLCFLGGVFLLFLFRRRESASGNTAR
ncbi:MAG TPA: hypothetical protein DCE41_37505 [Cytophagales bacterium]|nr:hypothetical protein [Cytophagales bacterium]HAA20584.1 hypothetical protein [Cytophagales bacterium]